MFTGSYGYLQWGQRYVPGPPPREGAAIAYDPLLGGAVLFGGQNNTTFYSDTWFFSGTSLDWSQLDPASSPPAMAYASMVWDNTNDSLVLFGGMDPSGHALGGTWVFQGGKWAEIDETSHPSSRWSASMSYDPTDGVDYLFGGRNATTILSDTWVYQEGIWISLNLTTGPGARYAAAMASTAGGHPLLFGGFGAAGPTNDTWMFVNGTWTDLALLFAPSVPSPGPVGGAVLMPTLGIANNAFLLVGGSPFTSPTTGNWILNVPSGGNPGGLVLSITESTLNGTSPLFVKFTSDVSGGFPPYNYTWNFGDQSPWAHGQSVSHVFQTTFSTSFSVTLTVSDSRGDKAVTSIAVAVAPAPPVPPQPPWALYALESVVAALVVLVGYVEARTIARRRRQHELDIESLDIRKQLPYPFSLEPLFEDLVRTREIRPFLRLAYKRTRAWWRPAAGELTVGRRKLRSLSFWLVRNIINVAAKLVIVVTVMFILLQASTWLTPGAAQQSVPRLLNSWWDSVEGFFTGTWISTPVGVSAYFTAPGVTVLLASTLELMLVALLISTLIAYPLGLLSGWHRGGKVDGVTRAYSTLGLFFPTIIICLLFVGWFYLLWIDTFGSDTSIFGMLPQLGSWYANHYGKVPDWINLYGTTSPTGFPIVDAGLHQAWFLMEMLIVKTLLQGFIAALTYSAVYLRYLRASMADAAEETYLVAARSRGVKERKLLWTHASKRAMPLYVSTFATTFSAFLLIVAMVEVIFDDVGMGRSIFFSISYGDVTSLIPVVYVFAIMVIVTNVVADGLVKVLDKRATSENVLRS
jgi:ABC-type dipeptide/oligopeptide/nickel transport system permease component